MKDFNLWVKIPLTLLRKFPCNRVFLAECSEDLEESEGTTAEILAEIGNGMKPHVRLNDSVSKALILLDKKRLIFWSNFLGWPEERLLRR